MVPSIPSTAFSCLILFAEGTKPGGLSKEFCLTPLTPEGTVLRVLEEFCVTSVSAEGREPMRVLIASCLTSFPPDDMLLIRGSCDIPGSLGGLLERENLTLLEATLSPAGLSLSGALRISVAPWADCLAKGLYSCGLYSFSE